MLRVGNLERSLGFYVETLGMTLFRREEYLDGRFTGSRSPSSDTAMSSRPP
jgi:catechol 2,3-dioxygenase-like lactoylglutathione lyase family enzyme